MFPSVRKVLAAPTYNVPFKIEDSQHYCSIKIYGLDVTDFVLLQSSFFWTWLNPQIDEVQSLNGLGLTYFPNGLGYVSLSNQFSSDSEMKTSDQLVIHFTAANGSIILE